MDDWSDLDAFRAVAEAGSLAGAARRLNVSHPTIGRRIDALEARLGVALIVRGASGIELTDAGAAIIDNVRRMGLEADAVHRLAAGVDSGLAGVVSISAFEGIGGTVVPQLLAELRAQHPDIVCHLDITNQTANLIRREADIALRIGQPGQQASLIARRVITIGMGFYAAPAYLDARGRPQRVADLAEHDVVAAAQGVGPRWAGEIDGEPLIAGRATFESLSPPALFHAVEAGFGIGMLSHWRARGRATLERVLPNAEPPAVDVWLVTHPDIKKSARVRVVFDHLAERLAANAKRFLEGDANAPETIV